MSSQVADAASTRPVGPPPPFDSELAPVVEMLVSLRPPDAYRRDNIIEMRQPVPGVETPTDEILSRGGAYRVEERTVPGPDGAPDISLRCLPRDASTPTAAIYHTHGGGMIEGDNRFGVVEMLNLAAPLGMAVVSVEYRLAPETTHPGPVEDCYAGLKWMSAHAGELNIDPERIVIAGMSAGGGLAAGVTLMARDRNGPSVLAQLLLCPMLDDRNDSPSSRQMQGLGIWDIASTRPDGMRCSVTVSVEDRRCLRTPPLRGPRTWQDCLPPSSTSGQLRRSETRMSPTQAASGRRVGGQSSTYGPAGSTGSMLRSPTPRSRRTPSPPARHGCAGSFKEVVPRWETWSHD